MRVLKFGGTSLATQDSRNVAGRRVQEVVERGQRPVVVVSAMGRSPDPYATDSLSRLLPDSADNRNRDLLVSCGELISAAVFASELCAHGITAEALTGAQAGMRCDATFGDARIVSVEPSRVRDAIERRVVPVITGFQGVTDGGDVVTLGRGGSDLTAIALAHALDAAETDIYTDVSGAHTADPRRVEGAQPIDRASQDEMTELAEHGAKVMHHKAAEYARRTRTAYAIKGLETGVGTLVDDTVEHRRPVTGVAVSGRVTWIRGIRGDIEDQQRRMQTEMELFERVARAAISIDQVTINQAGVMFVIEGDRGADIRALLADLNMAVRVREGCAKLSVVGAGMRYEPGVIARIVTALSAANVEIIHCTDSNITVSVLVPAADANRAEQAIHDAFELERREALP
ncbi:MAG: aspartate kinase [Candidatus Eremiobacteraeota bacterium]|nr:aspartate kinase [Candidatus Eremiobacteraeota bacterium]